LVPVVGRKGPNCSRLSKGSINFRGKSGIAEKRKGRRI